MPRDVMTPVLTSLAVVVGTIATQLLNTRKAKSRSKVYDRIEQKIDVYQAETRAAYQAVNTRIDEVAGVAEDALSQCIGPAPDRQNGLKSRVTDLEIWQESETKRERDRLQRIADGVEEDRRTGPAERRGMEPRDVGSLNPGGAI